MKTLLKVFQPLLTRHISNLTILLAIAFLLGSAAHSQATEMVRKCYCHNICHGNQDEQCTSNEGLQNGHQDEVDCHEANLLSSCTKESPCSIEDTLGKCDGCGNGKLDADEECDDGNNQNGDGCDENCKLENCGNGQINAYEDCDGANLGACQFACNANCTCETDRCPNDPDKTDPGICGCGTPDTDSDGDGIADCLDQCPNDNNKIIPGQCGCGIADSDIDGDGTPDCEDGCLSDPKKIEPGICGCGLSDTDSDQDGMPDCKDTCSEDPAKIDAGACGCGTAEQDSDQDGTPDCFDLCPNDSNKVEPGNCGCGNDESESCGKVVATGTVQKQDLQPLLEGTGSSCSLLNESAASGNSMDFFGFAATGVFLLGPFLKRYF